MGVCTLVRRKRGSARRVEKFGQRREREPSKRRFLVNAAERLARMVAGGEDSDCDVRRRPFFGWIAG